MSSTTNNSPSPRPHYDMERLHQLSALDVVRHVGATAKGRQKWRRTKCLWHDDTHPSLLFTAQGSTFYCPACGKRGVSVIDYVMAYFGIDFMEACEWLSREFGIPYDSNETRPQRTYTRNIKMSVPQKTTPTVFVPTEYAASTISDRSTFCQCLCRLFEPHLVRFLVEEYQLGLYEDPKLEGLTIFWTIDTEGRYRNGKLQNYCTDTDNAQFFHCQKFWNGCRSVWIGSSLARRGIVPLPEGTKADDVTFDIDCLFGAHLLKRHPKLPVAIVESPKNAILGAAIMPKHLWVATGSKSMFTPEVLAPLQGRPAVAFPDSDAVEDWSELAATMRYADGTKVSDNISILDLRKALNIDTATKGYDIADYIIAKRMSQINSK